MSKRNLIAHYKLGKSDKIYMSCVRPDGAGGWIVLGKYGRRGKMMQSIIKLLTKSKAVAITEQTKVFGKELRKGYIDIDSPIYRGDVFRGTYGVKQALEEEDVETTNSALPRCTICGEEMPETVAGNPACRACTLIKIKNETIQVAEDDTVLCVDNLGITDRFDLDIEYVCERHSDNKMIWVYDKLGRKDEYFKDRFMSCVPPMKIEFAKFREGETANVRLIGDIDFYASREHFRNAAKRMERK